MVNKFLSKTGASINLILLYKAYFLSINNLDSSFLKKYAKTGKFLRSA